MTNKKRATVAPQLAHNAVSLSHRRCQRERRRATLPPAFGGEAVASRRAHLLFGVQALAFVRRVGVRTLQLQRNAGVAAGALQRQRDVYDVRARSGGQLGCRDLHLGGAAACVGLLGRVQVTSEQPRGRNALCGCRLRCRRRCTPPLRCRCVGRHRAGRAGSDSVLSLQHRPPPKPALGCSNCGRWLKTKIGWIVGSG